MNTKDLLDKIEKLEARIRDLEARPVYVSQPIHIHPAPALPPVLPWPYYVTPVPTYPHWTITCGDGGNYAGIAGNAVTYSGGAIS